LIPNISYAASFTFIMSISVLVIVHDTECAPSRKLQCPMQSPMPAAHMLDPAMWTLFLYEDVLSTSI
jgi:hypothetical protein